MLRPNPHRRDLVAKIDAVVADFEHRRKEPDRWEKLCTMRALDHLARGQLRAAEKELALLQFPHELRPASAFKDLPPDFDLFGTKELCVVLTEINAEYAVAKMRKARGGP